MSSIGKRLVSTSLFTRMLVALFGVVLCGLSTTATASISFNASSRTASTAPVSSLSWSHALGSGADRIVIIGVACENNLRRRHGHYSDTALLCPEFELACRRDLHGQGDVSRLNSRRRCGSGVTLRRSANRPGERGHPHGYQRCRLDLHQHYNLDQRRVGG